MSKLSDIIYNLFMGSVPNIPRSSGNWDDNEIIIKCEDELNKELTAEQFDKVLEFAVNIQEEYFRRGFEIALSLLK